MSRSRSIVPLAAMSVLALELAGCAAVKGIFKAGVWVGVVAVLFVIGLIALLAKALAR